MTTEPPKPTTVEDLQKLGLPYLRWSAIIGGTIAAMAINILLTTLVIGIGLAIFTPVTDIHPVANFNVGAAVAWSLCAIIALWFGGLVAGRFSHSLHSGFVHGMLVWSLTLIISLVLLSMGTSMILGGTLKILGAGGQAVASGLGDAAKEAASRSSDQLDSFLEEAVQSMRTNTPPQTITRAKRQIGFALTKLFTPGNDNQLQDNREAAIKALEDYAGMSEADATRTIDDWITSYNNLKAELNNAKTAAEEKARSAADESAHYLSCTAIWSFFALLIGLLAASLGGSCGAKYALRPAHL